MEALKKCLNPKVLIGLGIVGAALFVFAPKFALAALPLLFIAACPLSMILMMSMMGGKHNKNTSYKQIDILKQRFPKGDITEQEFEQMKTQLQPLLVSPNSKTKFIPSKAIATPRSKNNKPINQAAN